MSEKNTIFAPFKGTVLAYIITALIFALYGLLLTYTNISEKNSSLIVLITMAIALVAGGIKSAASAKSRGWLVGALTGLMYVVIMVVTGFCVLSDFSLGSKTVLCLVLGVASGAIGGIVGINIGKK